MRTPQDLASVHSAFGARNLLFLAPLHSLQLRVYCDVVCGRRSGCVSIRPALTKTSLASQVASPGYHTSFSELFLYLQRIHTFSVYSASIFYHQRISAVSFFSIPASGGDKLDDDE
jgi:hypothetical protein